MAPKTSKEASSSGYAVPDDQKKLVPEPKVVSGKRDFFFKFSGDINSVSDEFKAKFDGKSKDEIAEMEKELKLKVEQSILELEYAKSKVEGEVKPSTTPSTTNFQVVIQHKTAQAKFDASSDMTATSLRDQASEHFGYTKPYTKLNLYLNDEKLTDGKRNTLQGKAFKERNISIGEGTVLVLI